MDKKTSLRICCLGLLVMAVFVHVAVCEWEWWVDPEDLADVSVKGRLPQGAIVWTEYFLISAAPFLNSGMVVLAGFLAPGALTLLAMFLWGMSVSGGPPAVETPSMGGPIARQGAP